MEYLNAFLCGGLLCAVGQIILDKTSLTPARILTGYVVAGVLLQAVGVYQYIVDWGGAGATVPLTGFGYSLAKGVAKAVAEDGLLGVLTGGLSATSGGIAAAVVLSLLAALLVRPEKVKQKMPCFFNKLFCVILCIFGSTKRPPAKVPPVAYALSCYFCVIFVCYACVFLLNMNEREQHALRRHPLGQRRVRTAPA